MADAASRARQRGLSLFGVLLLGTVLVMLVVLGMRVMPAVLEYRAIKRALYSVSVSGATSPLDIQRAFDRQASIDDIASVRGKDLLIERAGDKVVISVQYDKRVPLFGPVSLMIEFEGSSPLR